MNRPKLIKKTGNTAKNEPLAGGAPSRPARRPKREAVLEWIESRRNEREDPRKAFAALFTQPQTSRTG